MRKLTEEQKAIIESDGNIKINAVAGSGKTTTVIEYAKKRQRDSRILYLAFNRSVKLEAESRFREESIGGVNVETAHSLAYKYIMNRNAYKLRAQGYKTYELAELLGLRVKGELNAEYVVANHINKFISYFCNSDKPKVQDLNYLEVVSDSDAKVFVTRYYEYIEKQTRVLLSKMDKGEIEITHDFYLKKFQIESPMLRYDYILFDEGQDASSAMLDVFMKQEAVKVIVGDTNQQIYGWRYAVNSLEKVDFRSFSLTNSFRFSQNIAKLAMEIIQLKKIIGYNYKTKISGLGSSNETAMKATLARTNLGLLSEAIKFVTEKRNVNKLYFEGNFNSYTYADEGASLYDVLNLKNFNRKMIRDTIIKKMKDIDELEEYAKKTDDVQLSMMIDLVNDYGNSLPGILRNIKEKHIEDENRAKADMIFSTVHRCKGMEYDSVTLATDFITEKRINKMLPDAKLSSIEMAKLNEEINILYVAATRTKNRLYIPKSILPEDFPEMPKIHVIEKFDNDIFEETEKFKYSGASNSNKRQKNYYKKNSDGKKSYTVDSARSINKEAYKPWSESEDNTLIKLYFKGKTAKEIAEILGRSTGAIMLRFKKLKID